MKKKITPFMLFVLLTCLSCTNHTPLVSQQVTISGEVTNRDSSLSDVIRIIFCHPLDDYQKTCKLDSTKDFLAKHEMIMPQNMTIQYEYTFINLFVKPGDSVHVSIDGAQFKKNPTQGITFSGDNAAFNNQLNACVQYLYNQPSATFDIRLSPDSFLACVKAEIEKRRQVLDAYARENNLSSDVIRWAQRDIVYFVANDIMNYKGNGQSEEEKKSMQLQVFSDPLFEINNPDNFQSMLYPYHLGSFQQAFLQIDTAITAAIQKQDFPTYVSAGIKRLSELEKGICADYMLYDFLAQCLKNEPNIYDTLDNPQQMFSQPVFAEYLNKLAMRMQQPTFEVVPLDGVCFLTAQQTLEAVPDETDLIQYLTQKYPHKVLYIDVWATWCGPCRESFSAAKEVHKFFAGQDVVFVNLCLQSDQEKWIKTISMLDIQGENYFLDERATKLFISGYQLSGYPSYLLIDRQGNMVTTKAPNPHSNKVYEDISKLLK